MSKPVFEDLFTFSGRRNRKSYIYYNVALFGIGMFLITIYSAAAATFSVFWMSIATLLFIPMIISAYAVGAQRIRDQGFSGWFMLLSIIPYINTILFILLIAREGEGDNIYGSAIVAPQNTAIPSSAKDTL
jgi:uncharacterized membrane protein YhaH (DUF805 family)